MRNNIWLQQKEIKIERAREASKDKDLEGCTFEPKFLTKTKREMPPRPPGYKINYTATS
jgi:hypothetical protein